jgi:outer membrane protein TolC
MLALGALVFAPAMLEAQQPSTTNSTGQPLPLSLDEALRRAVGASENVVIAKSGEQRARGQIFQAKSVLMPQLATTVNWQKQLQNQFASIARSAGAVDSGAGTTPSFTRIFASEYNFNLGITGSQALYTGGRAMAGIRAARAGRESAEIGITSAQAQSQLDVTQAYYDAVLADRLLSISDSSLVQAERTLRQVQISRSVGSTAEFELIRARDTRQPAAGMVAVTHAA